MGEGAEQAQRIDCLLEEGRNAETILQHTKKHVAWFSDDSYSKTKTPGGRRQSRVDIYKPYCLMTIYGNEKKNVSIIWFLPIKKSLNTSQNLSSYEEKF